MVVCVWLMCLIEGVDTFEKDLCVCLADVLFGALLDTLLLRATSKGTYG